MGGPAQRISCDAGALQLGEAITAALGACRVHFPSEGEVGTADTVARSVGFRSFGDLQANASHLMVWLEDEEVTVQGMMAMPGGYRGDPELVRNCPRDKAAFGQAVIDLRPRCTPRRVLPIRPAPNRFQPARPRTIDPVDVSVPFGYKSTWIVVPCDDPNQVATSLGLRSVCPCSWREGITRAYNIKGVFVCPPIHGWTMAVGCVGEVEDPELLPFLERLSDEFGQACFFCTHRGVGLHVWARAERGKITRAFGQGENLSWNTGDRTPEEVELDFGRADDERRLDEEDVLTLAGRWTLNPCDVDMHADACGPGMFGER